jgi:protocatechuate 3,4-dioxygenase beta subunit
LTGTVLDSAGKTIQGAAVTVKNESTGSGSKTVTDSDGRFSVTGLSPGTYTIEGAAPNFASTTRTGQQLAADGT